MPTASERMLELSSLASGATAREHFLSIRKSVSNTGPLQIFDQMQVELEMSDYTVSIEPELEVVLEESEYSVQLEENEYEVEVC